MKNEQDLTGALVMVDRAQWDDSVKRQGEIGTVFRADLSRNEICVRFEDESEELYDANALLFMNSPDALYHLIETQKSTLTPGTVKDLQSLALLQQYGSAKQLRTAFELVQQNDRLDRYALTPMDELLKLNQFRKRSR